MPFESLILLSFGAINGRFVGESEYGSTDGTCAGASAKRSLIMPKSGIGGSIVLVDELQYTMVV
jgi:cobalamin biosynthesis protein CbiD